MTAKTESLVVQHTAFFDGMASYNSAIWTKREGANNSPFGCGFTGSQASWSSNIMTFKLQNTSAYGKPYASEELQSVNSFNSGWFESNLETAKGSGLVTAFVTYGNTSKDEIDFEFQGKAPTTVQTNYYLGGVGGHELVINLGFDASAGYHKYKIEWVAGSYIKWYVDGVVVRTVTGSVPTHTDMQIMPALWNQDGTVDSWLGAFSYAGPYYARYDYIQYGPL